jgi:hypothetical protein
MVEGSLKSEKINRVQYLFKTNIFKSDFGKF